MAWCVLRVFKCHETDDKNATHTFDYTLCERGAVYNSVAVHNIHTSSPTKWLKIKSKHFFLTLLVNDKSCHGEAGRRASEHSARFTLYNIINYGYESKRFSIKPLLYRWLNTIIYRVSHNDLSHGITFFVFDILKFFFLHNP